LSDAAHTFLYANKSSLLTYLVSYLTVKLFNLLITSRKWYFTLQYDKNRTV